MKRIHFVKLLLVAVLTTGSLNAWGETLTFTNIGAGLSTTANTEAATTTINEYTFNYYQCKQQTSSTNSYVFLTKSASPYFGNATAIPGTITSVSVTIPSGASTKTAYTIGFSTSPIMSADECKTTLGKGANTTFSANNSVSGATYFAVSLGNANNGQIYSITITYESSGSTETTVFQQAGTPAHPDRTPPPCPLPASGAGELASQRCGVV